MLKFDDDWMIIQSIKICLNKRLKLKKNFTRAQGSVLEFTSEIRMWML